MSLQVGIPSSMSTFLVDTNGIRILFDTGMGAPGSRLLPGLQSLGISPADIGYLYLTYHNNRLAVYIPLLPTNYPELNPKEQTVHRK